MGLSQRCQRVEKALPGEVRKKFPTDPSPTLPGADAGLGWLNFPNYNTFTQLTVPHRHGLSNLCGWVVQQNKALFQKAFGGLIDGIGIVHCMVV